MAEKKPKSVFKRTNISRVSFGIDNASQIQKQAHICVVNTEFYEKDDPLRTPLEYGPLDRRMGLNNPKGDLSCKTCDKHLWDCVGHFGYIDLTLPVYHHGFFNYIFDILQTICKNCSRVMLDPRKRQEFREKLSKESLTYVSKKSIRKQILEIAKKTKICPHCKQRNGTVKKMFAGLKFMYENPDNPDTNHVTENDEIMKNINSLTVFSQVDVMNLLERIPLEDIPLLLMNPSCGHPKDLVLTRIPVPPVCIRPSADVDDGTREDELTQKLSEILLVNDGVDFHIQSGLEIENLVDCWNELQYHCAWYINGQIPSPNYNMKNLCTKTLVQRLKGKKGRFRQNLSGKRVDFTARSVISPNPNLKITEVGLPVDIAKQLTYAEHVRKENKKFMKKLIRNGPDIYPGATNIFKKGKSANSPINLSFCRRKQAANELKCGDIVERHLRNGDIVLFNRQPSLHKLSFMSHKIRVVENKTLTLNPCICTPYNADFDGDEMNIHVPQTEEAKAEAVVLMSCNSNLISPRNGNLSIGAIQDFITGSYLLTQKDVFLSKEKVWNLVACLLSEEDRNVAIDFPLPAICKPVELWTGKQVIGILLRPNNTCEEKVNLSVKESKHTENYELCADDSHVIIHNSELLAGYLDKSVLGSGSKISVFYVALRDYGKDYAAKCMWRLCRLVSYYITNRGFSFGIGDVSPTSELKQVKKEKCTDVLETYNRHNTNVEITQSLAFESKLADKLSEIRDDLGRECIEKLHSSNAARIMAVCGSKGSTANVAQMISCVGQQIVNNRRISHGFTNRSFPHFECNSSHPKSKGFVENSFSNGLSPTEFFFHAIAGREGLLDTAVKTSETGYMQRKLIKSMEDLCVQYDGSVRDSVGNVIQLTYGYDGFDQTHMETNEFPINFQRVLNHIRNKYPFKNESCITSRYEISEIEEEFKEKLSICSTRYRNSLSEYLHNFNPEFSNIEDKRITKSQLADFLELCADTYIKAIVEPGTPVGANAAQSIGEPATQMTLKTFHFAGVASMNVTQGIPRLKQIIAAAKMTRDSIISVALDSDVQAEVVANRIRKTYLKDIGNFENSPLEITLDQDKLSELRITPEKIKDKIMAINKLKLKDDMVTINGYEIKIDIKNNPVDDLESHLRMMSEEISKIIVQGLTSDKCVTIITDSETPTPYDLLVQETSLRDIMGIIGVNGLETISNNPLDVFSALGIEAARSSIINEMTQLMENHQVNIDQRHLTLLADLMTSRGEVLGMDRSGLTKTKDSVLDNASFETTINTLFDAAYYGQTNEIAGVSESIIVGAPIPMGTSFFKLYKDPEKTVNT